MIADKRENTIYDDAKIKSAVQEKVHHNSSHQTERRILNLRQIPPGEVIYMEAKDMKELLQSAKTAIDFLLLAQHMVSYDEYRYTYYRHHSAQHELIRDYALQGRSVTAENIASYNTDHPSRRSHLFLKKLLMKMKFLDLLD